MSLIAMGDIPGHHANRLGADRWCVRHGDENLTWGDLSRRSTRRAWALKALGVKKDDIVVLGLPNTAALYELAFAAWKLGAIPSVVSWKLPLAEFKAILELAKPAAVFAAEPTLRQAVGALPPEFGLAEGRDDFLVSESSAYWKAMTSGGSTGRPKIIVDHMPNQVDPDVDVMMMPGDSVMLNPGPCYHNAPFAMTCNALFKGSSVVGMTKFDPEEALRLIDKHRVAWVNFVPTMMNRIYRLPEEVRRNYDISSIKILWHMAAPMPIWLKEKWIDWIGADKIFELYGGTERQGLTAISGSEWLKHKGSVGKPMGCGVRVLGGDGGILPAGEIGEIFLKPDAGPGSTYHYIGSTPKSLDGWESIGDFGWLDEEGYVYLADRRTDMINSGGANIYPAEIENALLEHPGLDGAIVIGLPDDDMGATVHAIVKRDPAWSGTVSEASLKEFLAARLARYKVPRSFEFTQESMRDDAGKVRRGAMREERIKRQPSGH